MQDSCKFLILNRECNDSVQHERVPGESLGIQACRAPAGYVATKDAGQLTDVVRRNLYAVLLFDEFEKAHRNISALLLQALDALGFPHRFTRPSGRLQKHINCINFHPWCGSTSSRAPKIQIKLVWRLYQPKPKIEVIETVRSPFSP